MTSPVPLPAKAADTSAESPWPVRLLAMKIGEYVERMSVLWVEGQVVQLTRRPAATSYLTLRDPDVDMSLSVTIATRILQALPMPLTDGARVVVHAKPVFWPKRGTLHLEARSLRPVGVGELLARLEHLKRLLAAEGLFAADRKRRLPFLPRRVGLICGRASAAEHDVVQNARRRHPSVEFEIRQVPVQGPDAVAAVLAELRALDRRADVDVIVIARGGGSFEDLLPFSNEALIRAVADAATPVVSAIGHDIDTPLLDLVADVRASTPTDAGKRIVPDIADELGRLASLRQRSASAVTGRLQAESRMLETLRARPVMREAGRLLDPHREVLAATRRRGQRCLSGLLDRSADQVGHLTARLRALSPGATLSRGYAIVQHANGQVVRDRADLLAGELLRVRVANGDFGARVVGRQDGAPGQHLDGFPAVEGPAEPRSSQPRPKVP